LSRWCYILKLSIIFIVRAVAGLESFVPNHQKKSAAVSNALSLLKQLQNWSIIVPESISKQTMLEGQM